MAEFQPLPCRCSLAHSTSLLVSSLAVGAFPHSSPDPGAAGEGAGLAGRAVPGRLLAEQCHLPREKSTDRERLSSASAPRLSGIAAAAAARRLINVPCPVYT